jgi:hypothetical protein
VHGRLTLGEVVCLRGNAPTQLLLPDLLLLRRACTQNDFVQTMAVLKDELPGVHRRMTLDASSVVHFFHAGICKPDGSDNSVRCMTTVGGSQDKARLVKNADHVLALDAGFWGLECDV